MNVLVVDSDPIARNLITGRFNVMGWRCETAQAAEEAYELFREQSFDLIITEVILLGSSGYELCRMVRGDQDEIKKQAGIIILSFMERTEDIVEGLKSGADEYVTKPFDFVELEARVEALLRRTCQPQLA